jgi:hypothetical protein
MRFRNAFVVLLCVSVSLPASAQEQEYFTEEDPIAAEARQAALPTPTPTPPPPVITFDSIGCSIQGIAMSSADDLADTMMSSLWTFRSEKWNGYIDFQDNGKYWTHWGFGEWEVDEVGKIFMANQYNQYTFEVSITADGRHFDGRRSDGLQISGDLICGHYKGLAPGMQNTPEEAIKKAYRDVGKPEINRQDLAYWLDQIARGKTIAEVEDLIRRSFPPPPPEESQ